MILSVDSQTILILNKGLTYMENIYILVMTFFFSATEKSTKSGFNKLEKADSR